MWKDPENFFNEIQEKLNQEFYIPDDETEVKDQFGNKKRFKKMSTIFKRNARAASSYKMYKDESNQKAFKVTN